VRLGRPRYRKTKTFIGGLLRLTFSKTKGREGRLTKSVKIGPWSKSSTGRQQLSFWGIQIPIRKGNQ
jgi:hypothetical protein